MKLSEIMSVDVSPTALTITSVILFIIATPFVFTGISTQLSASATRKVSIICEESVDCQNYYKNCQFTCLNKQCAPLTTTDNLKPYPDCSIVEPASTVKPNTNPLVTSTPSDQKTLPLESPTPIIEGSLGIPLPTITPEITCQTKCLYRQKNPFGEGNNAVFSVDCFGKQIYCGIADGSKEDLCLIDAEGAKCKNVTPLAPNNSVSNSIITFLSKTAMAVFVVLKVATQTVADTFKSLLHL